MGDDGSDLQKRVVVSKCYSKIETSSSQLQIHKSVSQSACVSLPYSLSHDHTQFDRQSFRHFLAVEWLST